MSYNENDYEEVIRELSNYADSGKLKTGTAMKAVGVIYQLLGEIKNLEDEISDREECSFREHAAMHYWRDRAREYEKFIKKMYGEMKLNF